MLNKKHYLLVTLLALMMFSSGLWPNASGAQSSLPIGAESPAPAGEPQEGQETAFSQSSKAVTSTALGQKSFFPGLFDDVWTPSAVTQDVEGSIHFVAEIFVEGQPEVYYVKAKDDLVLEIVNLSQNPSSSMHPDLYVSDTEVHVVWQDNLSGTDQVYHRWRSEGQWVAAQPITDSPSGAYAPKLMVEQDEQVQVEWIEYTQNQTDAYRCTWTGDSCAGRNSVSSLPQTPKPLSIEASAALRTLAFLRDREIWTVQEDGSGLRRVTNSGGRVYAFAWSPGGQQLAYTRLTNLEYQECDIYIINLDGTAERRLTTGIGADRWVIDWRGDKIAFSHGGTEYPSDRIAYVTTGGSVADISGDIENYGVGFNLFSWPRLRWSPDGQWIALSAGWANAVVSLGGLQRLIYEWLQPDWNRDSTHLIYDSGKIRKYYPATGSSTLLSSVAPDFPTYSPDNQYIVYGSPSLRRMNSNNTGNILITSDKAAFMDWSDLGDKIAYTRWYDNGTPWPGIYGVYVIGYSGSGRRQVSSGDDESPRWQPQVASYSVSGRVTTQEGSGIPGVTISTDKGQTVITDVNGNYSLSGIGSGTYNITPSKSGYTFTPNRRTISVPPSASVVDFIGYDKPPIVFVHGWNGLSSSCDWVPPEDYFQEIDNALHDQGYYIEYANLESSSCYTPPIEENVWRLDNAIQFAKVATNQPRVILIAHSMGGLVSRAYIEGPDYDNDVAQLFTFGSPHQGVPDDLLAFFANGLSLGTYCEYQAAACDFSYLGMRLFNQRHPLRADGVTYHVVSGDAPFSPRTVQGMLMDVLLPGADDGAVQAWSGLGLTGALDRWITDETHGSGSGPRNYFARDGGLSTSYNQCLKRVLVDGTLDYCGTFGPSQTMGAAADAVTPSSTLNRRSPFLFGNLQSGQMGSHPVVLEGGAALFGVQWKSGTLLITLVSPSGQVIDPAYAAAHPEIATFQESGGYAAYSLPDAAVGTWQVRIQATNAPAAGAAYTAFATFESGLTLTGSTDRLWYAPGTSAVISAILAPAPQNATVTAVILLADSSSTSVTLASLGNGQYRGNYTVPTKPGYAEVRVGATGINSGGIPFQRGASLAFQISPSTIALNGVFGDTPEPRGTGAITYKSLQVAVGVTASRNGTYGLSADLVDSVGNRIAHANAIGDLTSGTGALTLHFPGADIHAAKQDGPYTLTNLLLTDQSGTTLVAQEAHNVYTTAAYRYRDFRIGDLFLPLVIK